MGTSQPCEWHVIIVDTNDGDDPVISVMHPSSCALNILVDGERTSISYCCFVGYEIENGGFDLFLSGFEVDSNQQLAGYKPGWYKTRGMMVTLSGGPWGSTEYDAEAETESITWQEIKSVVETIPAV